MSFRPEATARTPVGERSWIWLIAIWAIVTAYNLFKPFHIDDTAHLEIAQWIMDHPLHPMSGILNWSGVDEPIHRTNQPHLWFYLMALWGRAFGFSEPAQHALQSIPALAGILIFHRIALSMSKPLAMWATAITFLGPAFIVEQNMMVDTPLLATWLAFFMVLVCGVRSENQTRRYVLAGLACAAALLIKYSSLTLLPIIGLSLALERRRDQVWTLLIPLGALAAWSAFNYLDYGGIHILARPVGRAGHGMTPLSFALAWLVTLGGVTPLGLIAVLQGRMGERFGPRIFAGAGAAFALLILAVASGAVADKLADKILWVAFAANAAVIAAVLAAEAARVWRPGFLQPGFWGSEAALDAAPSVYLLLWVAGTSAFYMLFSPFVAARHVLLILPPVTLLLIGRWRGGLAPGARTFGLLATAVVSAGLCLSDWRFADFYRVEAQSLRSSFPGSGAIWVNGHWGFQWYAKSNGLREVDVRHPRLAPGDLLAAAPGVNHQDIQPPPPMTLLSTDAQPHPLLSLFCTARPARFYATTNSRLAPWSLDRDCIGHIQIFRVVGRPDGGRAGH